VRSPLERDARQTGRSLTSCDAATEQIVKRFDNRHSDPRALIKESISLPFRGHSAQRAASI
jgi:hypothetical protein